MRLFSMFPELNENQIKLLKRMFIAERLDELGGVQNVHGNYHTTTWRDGKAMKVVDRYKELEELHDK